MGLNKERVGSLRELSKRQLRKYWDQADNTPGEQVTVAGLGSVTKGEFYQELVGRDNRSPRINQSRTPWKRTFHPIDGSWGMRVPGKRGAIIARSKR